VTWVAVVLFGLAVVATWVAVAARDRALRGRVVELAGRSPGVKASELARLTGSDEMSMRVLLADMDRRGLVRLLPDGVDRRVWPS